MLALLSMWVSAPAHDGTSHSIFQHQHTLSNAISTFLLYTKLKPIPKSRTNHQTPRPFSVISHIVELYTDMCFQDRVSLGYRPKNHQNIEKFQISAKYNVSIFLSKSSTN